MCHPSCEVCHPSHRCLWFLFECGSITHFGEIEWGSSTLLFCFWYEQEQDNSDCREWHFYYLYDFSHAGGPHRSKMAAWRRQSQNCSRVPAVSLELIEHNQVVMLQHGNNKPPEFGKPVPMNSGGYQFSKLGLTIEGKCGVGSRSLSGS